MRSADVADAAAITAADDFFKHGRHATALIPKDLPSADLIQKTGPRAGFLDY